MSYQQNGKLRTFFLAAASTHRIMARSCADELVALGLHWKHDWIAAWSDDVATYTADSESDVDGACDADLFVYLADTNSPGGMLELGARIGWVRAFESLERMTGQTHLPPNIHVVGGEHFHFHNARVTRHNTWEQFMTWVKESRGT